MVEHEPFRELFHTGTVVYANTASGTCDIIKSTGGALNNVPILNSTGGFQTTDAAWANNYRGAVVAYTYLDGRPFIVGTVPTQSKPRIDVSTRMVNVETGGDNAVTYGRTTKEKFTSGRIVGHMPNDKVISADGGAELGLMAEGLAVLKASPLSQIILGSLMDFVHIVAREFKLSTDFGELCFSHGSSGRVGLSIRGGADYSEESVEGGEGESVNTFYMYAGDTPENPEARFGLRVNGTSEEDFGLLMVDRNGNLTTATTQNALLSVGKQLVTRVTDNEAHENDKDLDEVVKGEKSSTTYGDETITTYGDLTIFCGGTLKILCNGMEIHNAGPAPKKDEEKKSDSENSNANDGGNDAGIGSEIA